MQVQSEKFKAGAARSLNNPQLLKAMSNLRNRMVTGRAQSILELDNFEDIREAARATRDRALASLDYLLEEFERNATARGTTVHWAGCCPRPGSRP